VPEIRFGVYFLFSDRCPELQKNQKIGVFVFSISISRPAYTPNPMEMKKPKSNQ